MLYTQPAFRNLRYQLRVRIRVAATVSDCTHDDGDSAKTPLHSLCWCAAAVYVLSGSAGMCANTLADPAGGCHIQAAQQDVRKTVTVADSLRAQRRFSEASERVYAALERIGPDCENRPALLTEMAFIKLCAGDVRGALAISTELLNPRYRFPLSPEEIGASHLIMAKVFTKRMQLDRAQKEYAMTAEAFGGKAGAFTAAADVYSEMSLISLQLGNPDQAESYLDRGVAMLRKAKVDDASAEARIRDSKIHIAICRGRMSEAYRELDAATRAFSDNPHVAANVRSHLLRDEGQFAMGIRKYDQAVGYFSRARAIDESQPQTTGAAYTLALLASAEIAQHDLTAAEHTIEAAETNLAEAPWENPLTAARVAEVRGTLCVRTKDWESARASFLQCSETFAAIPNCKEEYRDAITQLAQADHHLGRKNEEKALKRKEKKIAAPSDGGQTVDVMALQASNAHK